MADTRVSITGANDFPFQVCIGAPPIGATITFPDASGYIIPEGKYKVLLEVLEWWEKHGRSFGATYAP